MENDSKTTLKLFSKKKKKLKNIYLSKNDTFENWKR